MENENEVPPDKLPADVFNDPQAVQHPNQDVEAIPGSVS
jgi:hypothetical protein